MKISPISYLIIGLAVGLIALFYGVIMQWMPNSKDAEAYTANTQAQNDQAALMPKAKKRVERAVAEVKAKDAAWQVYVAAKTPPDNVRAGGINLDENAYQLGIDTYTYRDSIQKALNKQLRSGGVKVLNAPTIQMLDPNVGVNSILTTFYNYPSIRFPVVMFDFGQITVQGTYSQIMNHVRAYKNMPNYLAVSDGLALTGTAPLLTATYNLSIVGFIRGKHIYPPVSEAATAGGGGGGGGLGRGGGFMTGPPAGMGGPGRGNLPPGLPPGAGAPGGAG